MLTVTYDSVNGDPVADGLAEQYAQHHCTQGTTELTICSSVAIDAFRVMVARGVISNTDTQFKFNDQIIKISPKGRLSAWPAGFCHFTDDFLSEL